MKRKAATNLITDHFFKQPRIQEFESSGPVENIESAEIPTQNKPSSLLDPAIGPHIYENCKNPIQPELCSQLNENKGRKFPQDWYQEFKWLERSVSTGKAYCHTCRIFAKEVGHVDGAFLTRGYCNWRKVSKVRDHELSACHTDATIAKVFLF